MDSTNVNKVEIVGVCKTYPARDKETADLVALDDVNLEIRRGEVLSIIGPSGCGKTTLLKCIDGLVAYDRGVVHINRDERDRGLRDRAFVFQDFSLFPWRTILGNVAFPLEVLGWSRKQRTQRAEEMLQRVGLSRFANSHPHELSGGMQQRVGLARALAVDPDVLLMDEPLGSLDEQTREDMQGWLLEVCRETHKTVILVTHSVDEAIFMSDRIAVMSRRPGRVIRILEVLLPTKRNKIETRASDEFGRLRREVWELLAPPTE